MSIFSKLREMFNSPFFIGVFDDEIEETSKTVDRRWILEALVTVPPYLLKRGKDDEPRKWIRLVKDDDTDFWDTLEEAERFIQSEAAIWNSRGFIRLSYSRDDEPAGVVGLPVRHILGWKISRVEDGTE